MWLSNQISITYKAQTIVWALLLCFNTAFTQTVTIKNFGGLYHHSGGNFIKNGNKIIYVTWAKLQLNGGIDYNIHIELNNNLDTTKTTLYASNTSTNSYSGFYPFQLGTTTKKYLVGGAPGYSTQSGGYVCQYIHNSNANYDDLGGKGYYSKNNFGAGQVIQTKDTGFVNYGSFKKNSSSFSDVVIFKRNKNLDSVWCKIYTNTFNAYNGEIATKIYELPNKDLMVSGYTDSVDAHDVFILLTDSAGNIKSSKSIGTNGDDDLRTIMIDNKPYMYGTTNGFCSTTKNNILLSKIDAYGNVSKSYIIGDTMSFRGSAIETKNHTILFSGWTYSYSGGKEYALCMEIDTNGTVLKYHKVNYNTQSVGSLGNYSNYFQGMIQDSSNNILLSQVEYNNTGSTSGYFQTNIVKLDSNLRGCKLSEVATYTTQNVTGQIHSVPLGFHVYRDSLFEATGTANLSHGFSGIINECSGFVGIKEQSIGNDVFKLYPNPSAGIFYYNYLTADENLGDAKLEVYDITGQLIVSGTLTNSNANGMIDLREVSNGMYFIKIATTTKILFNSKLNVVK